MTVFGIELRSPSTADLLVSLLAAGLQIGRDNPERGAQIKNLGFTLPYLLSGERDWGSMPPAQLTASAVLNAKALAAEYGFSLPDDPVQAVEAMLHLAMALFTPSHSVPLEDLRRFRPL